MILRKPYAFLIKYFKIIHIILFLIFAYLVFEIRNIYLFFTRYVQNNNFTYFENMADKYMNPLIFIMIVLIIAFAISVYLLMRKKEKPVLFYKILMVYGFVLLIFWIYFRYFFSTLDEISYDILTIIVYRDITAFIYYVNFFYVGFSFIRGFGFDIKKFSFDKDKKELNIEDTDDEEYELNLGVDKDNVANYIRRERREFRYYLKENRGFFIIASIVLVIILGVYFYHNRFVENKIYNEKDLVTVNSITFRINKTETTDLDKNSEVISDNYSFLIINMDLLNSDKDKRIEKENFRVKINNEYYYPVFNYNSSFDDIGQIYNENIIFKSNEGRNINFIYRINKEKINTIHFEMLKNVNDNYEFEKVILNPIKKVQEVKTIKIGDSIDIGNYQFKIIKYSFSDKTSYEYESCFGDKCSKLTKMVIPKLNNQVLILEIDDLKKLDKNFIENYLGLKYKVSDKEYYVSSRDISIIDDNGNEIYLSVPKSINNENILSLNFKTRENEFVIETGKNNE